MFTDPDTYYAVRRSQMEDLRVEAARARLAGVAASAEPAEAKPTSVGRLRAVARQALTALGSAPFAVGDNKPAAA